MSKSITALDFLGKHITGGASPVFNTEMSSSSSDISRHKTLDENLLRKNTLSLPETSKEIPIRDIDRYGGGSTSFSSNSNYEIRVPKDLETNNEKDSITNETKDTCQNLSEKLNDKIDEFLANIDNETHSNDKKVLYSSTNLTSSESGSLISNESIKPLVINNSTKTIISAAGQSLTDEKNEKLKSEPIDQQVPTEEQKIKMSKFKSNLKKKSKYEQADTLANNKEIKNQQLHREFIKTRSISTSTPKNHLRLNKSPHSWIPGNLFFSLTIIEDKSQMTLTFK